MPVESFETLFPEAWLHERPRVTDRKGNPTWRVSRADAVGFPYVEPNVTGVIQSFVIVDRDRDDTANAANRAGLPHPSWISLNGNTEAGHIGYDLEHPVPLTDAARRPPVNLLARIEHGLVNALDGDPGYTGGLTKNPLHPSHVTLWGPPAARYGLRELASALDDLGHLPGPGNPRRNVSRSAVGRNVALFDDTRTWAYKAVRNHWGAPQAHWTRAVLHQAHTYNETRIANDFTTGPLPTPEIGYLATSVANWVWERFTPESRARLIARTHTKERQAARQAKRAAQQRSAVLTLIEEATRD